MREIGSVTTEREAQRLVDALLAQGIKSQIDPSGAGWSVWVYDEDRVTLGRSILERFRANPDDPAFIDAGARAEKIRTETAAREKQARKNIVDVRSRWTNAASAGNPLTIALILISVAVGLMSRFGSDLADDSLVVKLFYVYDPADPKSRDLWRIISDPSNDEGRELWRLFTPIFIHFTPMHLLFNMMALHAEGSIIEMRRGTPRFLMFVLFLAIASNTAQFLWNGPAFGGMSGVCFGLFGYVWIKSRFDPGSGIYISPGNVMMMLFWLVLCMTGSVGRIANAAHLVGLIAGVVVAGVPLVRRQLMGR